MNHSFKIYEDKYLHTHGIIFELPINRFGMNLFK